MAVDRSTPGCTVVGELQYETDRARFLGRGRTPADPAALDPGAGSRGRPARSSTRSSASGAAFRLAPGGSAVVGVHPGRGRLARGGAGAGRPVPRHQRRGPGLRAGLGPQPGRARPSELVARGCPPVPAAGVAPPLRRLGAAGRIRPCSRRTARASRPSGDGASRATGRSSWPGSPRRTSSRWPGSSWSRTPSSGSRAWSSTWSCSTRSGATTPTASASSSHELVRQAGGDDLADKPGGVFVIPERGTLGGRLDPARGRGPRRPRRSAGGSSAGQLDRVEWGRTLPEPLVASQPPGHWDDEPVCLPAGLQFANGLGGFTRRRPRVLRARPVSGCRRPASSTASRPHAVLPPPSCPPPPGSTSSPTPRSASSSPRRARASPGPATARPTASRPGATTRSPTPRREVVYLRDEDDRPDLVPDPPARPLARPRRSSATARATRSSRGTPTASSTS